MSNRCKQRRATSDGEASINHQTAENLGLFCATANSNSNGIIRIVSSELMVSKNIVCQVWEILVERTTKPMSSLVRTFLITIILVTVLSSCDPVISPSLEITADDIPVYPNAHNITREGPLLITDTHGIAYIWKFTTSDKPEVVWKFYIDEMNRRWGFYGSTPQSEDKTLIVNSCPFYYLEETSTLVDIKTYSIAINFARQLCY